MGRFVLNVFVSLFTGIVLAGHPAGAGISDTQTSANMSADTEPTPTPTPSPMPPTDTPTPEARPALSPDQVGLFLVIHGGSDSDLLRTILTDSTTGEMIGTKNITIEKDAKAVVLYLPDSEEAIKLDSYISP